MRELVILVADGTMKAVFDAFFRREKWHMTLECGAFDLWPEEDVFHDPMHTNGGVYKQAHELLRPFTRTHQRALVVLDQQFGRERPAREVKDQIVERLRRNGWQDRKTRDGQRESRCAVVVIDPELEVWLWQDNPEVAQAVRFRGASLRDSLRKTGEWPEAAAKPVEPKETIQRLIRENRAPKTKVVYSRIARSVSTRHCRDGAFLELAEKLREWFPLEDE